MFLLQSYRTFLIIRQRKIVLMIGFLLISATVITDLVSSGIQGSAFFVSESLLFATYWLMFLPGLVVHRVLSGPGVRPWQQISLILAITVVQLVIYPALVNALAWAFLEHGFRYTQTLLYGLGTYPLITGLIYGCHLVSTTRFLPSAASASSATAEPIEVKETPVITEGASVGSQDASVLVQDASVLVQDAAVLVQDAAVLVQDASVLVEDASVLVQDASLLPNSPTRSFFSDTILVNNKHQRFKLPVREITYFSVNSPYVTIHHRREKYLLSDTLKRVFARLDPSLFLRIHRSTLVNLSAVKAYRSRLNGDYDLTLTDETVLRVSRKFAAEFKAAFARIKAPDGSGCRS